MMRHQSRGVSDIKDTIRFEIYLGSWACQCRTWGFVAEYTIGTLFLDVFFSFGILVRQGKAAYHVVVKVENGTRDCIDLGKISQK